MTESAIKTYNHARLRRNILSKDATKGIKTKSAASFVIIIEMRPLPTTSSRIVEASKRPWRFTSIETASLETAPERSRALEAARRATRLT
ncbi:hypothetical protein PYJP_11070 [Pyrofollis japonicus]|nr:hypothetical protein PYJP_11070 [Pyrofollis japonicus]